MSPEDRDTLTQMRAIQDRTEKTLAEIRGMRAQAPTQQVTQTNDSGTAKGVWIAATCCAVMLTAMFFVTLGLYWVAMDSRDRGHQMNALYQSVPGLRDLVQRQIYFDRKFTQEANMSTVPPIHPAPPMPPAPPAPNPPSPPPPPPDDDKPPVGGE